jgi:hypothetical protein
MSFLGREGAERSSKLTRSFINTYISRVNGYDYLPIKHMCVYVYTRIPHKHFNFDISKIKLLIVPQSSINLLLFYASPCSKCHLYAEIKNPKVILEPFPSSSLYAITKSS